MNARYRFLAAPIVLLFGLAFSACEQITANDVSTRSPMGMPSFGDRVYGEPPGASAGCQSAGSVTKVAAGDLAGQDLLMHIARDAAIEARPDLFWAMSATKTCAPASTALDGTGAR